MTDEQADRIVAAMRGAFEEAEIDAAEIERLEPIMTNDPKDRHVPACCSRAARTPSGLRSWRPKASRQTARSRCRRLPPTMLLSGHGLGGRRETVINRRPGGRR